MASVAEFEGWVSEHPYATGAIVFGGGLALLWMFGFIGGSSAPPPSGGGNASAFYAAEAAQSQAGAAIQLGTLQTAAATAQAKIQADAATAIAATGATMQTTINGQNTGRDNTIAAIGGLTATTLAGYQLQMTQSNNNTVYGQTLSNNDTAARIAASHDQAGVWQTALNTVIPQEMAAAGSAILDFGPSYGTVISSSYNPPTGDSLRAQGYSPTDAQKIIDQFFRFS